MYDSTSPILFTSAFLVAIAVFFISSLVHGARKDRRQFFDAISKPNSVWTWYKKAHTCIFHAFTIESVLFSLTCAQQSLRVLLVVFFAAVYLGPLPLAYYLESYAWLNVFGGIQCLVFFLTLIALFIAVSDLLPRIWAQKAPQTLLRCAKGPSALVLILLSPLIMLLYHLIRLAAPQATFTSFQEQRKQILDLVEDLEDEKTISDHDKRLITSVFNFRHRIAREIMRPRVELFCIPETMPIEEAAQKILQEGYSRVPIYQGNIDTITGILFYKDLLPAYMRQAAKQDALKAPVRTIAKKVFYCPETKNIASLLQEFRKRQVHLAVVVDEYGGTSGAVTIEDILEELVGEIADEYDEQETTYRKGPKGSWIVDAQLSLHDLADELGIVIPQEEDYDTVAGYVFFRLGSIPKPGMVLHHDRFEIKILKSNDRMVEEVLITPSSGTTDDQDTSTSQTADETNTQSS